MKKGLFIALLLLVACIGTQEAQAQDYKNAIGGRFGTSNGLTFKHFFNSGKAMDLILNIRDHDHHDHFYLVGLYEVHRPIPNAGGLNWYYGGGAHLFFVDHDHDGPGDDDADGGFGIDGVLGLDYKFNGAPINLSLDWKPALNIIPDTDGDLGWFGLSIRFAW